MQLKRLVHISLKVEKFVKFCYDKEYKGVIIIEKIICMFYYNTLCDNIVFD